MKDQVTLDRNATVRKKTWLDRYDDLPRPLRRGKYPFIILGTALPIISFFVFYVGVNFTSILLAFQRTKYVAGEEVTSFTLENFTSVFRSFTNAGSDLSIALKNTAIMFTVDLLMMIPIFLIAYGFSRNMRGSKYFRVMLYIPTIISETAFGTMITSILQDNVGALPVLLSKIGIQLPPLLTSYDNAYKTVICYCIWAGLYSSNLIIEGAIRRVPKEVLEAAAIDGANKRQEIIRIIIPMIWGTISTILILKVSHIFTITGPILMLTNGMYNTQTLNFWFYKSVAVDGSYNTAAAAGLVMTFAGLPIVFGFRWLVGKINANIEY